MDRIPETKNALVLRTDFSNDAAWEALCAEILRPVGPFRAYVDCLSDPQFEGISAEQVVGLLVSESNHSFIFLADHLAQTHPEHAVLVVDLNDEPGRSFRVIPSEAWAVENNLSISNMDFEEFAAAVDADGTFRGFAGS